jgi:hypothetical protein
MQCPRCGTERIGSFRFCLKCRLDYDSWEPLLAAPESVTTSDSARTSPGPFERGQPHEAPGSAAPVQAAPRPGHAARSGSAVDAVTGAPPPPTPRLTYLQRVRAADRAASAPQPASDHADLSFLTPIDTIVSDADEPSNDTHQGAPSREPEQLSAVEDRLAAEPATEPPLQAARSDEPEPFSWAQDHLAAETVPEPAREAALATPAPIQIGDLPGFEANAQLAASRTRQAARPISGRFPRRGRLGAGMMVAAAVIAAAVVVVLNGFQPRVAGLGTGPGDPSDAQGKARIVFGTSLIDGAVQSPVDRLSVGQSLAWVAFFARPTVNAEVTMSVVRLDGAAETPVFSTRLRIGSGKQQTTLSGFNSMLLGPGTFSVRILDGDTQIAEGKIAIGAEAS